MRTYFDVEKAMCFYAGYHRNPVNKIIHFVCIPLIFITSITLLSAFSHFLVRVIVVAYALSFIYMEPIAGLLYAPVIYLMYCVGSSDLVPFSTSATVWVATWVAQFIGHGLFEKRAPALVTNLPQSLHAAVFFVWLELLFALGYRPDLKGKVTQKHR
jgi:uncharacterized membrane protein YGL010W